MSFVEFGSRVSDLAYDICVAPCLVEVEETAAMGPGLNHEPDMPVMSEEDNSMIDLSSSTIRRNSTKENRTSVTHCSPPTCFGLPYQDHNYGAPPPPTPPSFSPPHESPVRINHIVDEDTNFSVISTSTVNEETHEGSITRCICDYDHDDEYMICCDKCLVWQHVDCMGLNRNNIPETYMCEKCEPRKIDKQKAKILQARKRVALTDTSDESDEDIATNIVRKPRNRYVRKRKEDEKSEKKNESPVKKKSPSKHNKERLDYKRAKLRRRTKSKSDTSTADEEAQDAWECSLEWFEKYEQAETNQYTADFQQISNTLQNQENEQKVLDQLQIQLCRVCEFNSCQKRLVSVSDLPRDQIMIEYRGRFLSAAHFHNQHPVFSRRLFPFVLFYKIDPDTDICVDAMKYGNDARFIRRSCKPNAEVQHVTLNGSIHLYISSTKKISKEEEITIPFDFSSKECINEVDCACDDENCCFGFRKNGIMDSGLETKRRSKRSSFTEEDSSQSLPGMNSPCKSCKGTPMKLSSYDSQQAISSVSSTAESSESKLPSDEQENDKPVTKSRRKMTREERKIDAIMRAFDQMEKAAQRRKQALDRIAQQKSQPVKLEENPVKVEVLPPAEKEEEKAVIVPICETICTDDDKTSTSVTNQAIKQKKGKRRRGSGTPSRRRTRTNSGGSDILSPDEMLTPVTALQCAVNSLPLPCDNASLPVTPSSSSSVSTHNSAPSPVLPLTPVIPKTKKILMHGWLQEKVDVNVPVSSPLSIHTEIGWNTAVRTRYVRCTKDSPIAGGISAAHLRRNSTSGQSKQSSGQGSAKKRWLKQAMYECSSCDVMTDDFNHLALQNGCTSPGLQIEINNAWTSPHEDVQTPLKKRRLMRASVESLSSPKSPLTPIAASDWLATSSESLEDSCCMSSTEEAIPSTHTIEVYQLNSRDVFLPMANNCSKEGSSTVIVNAKKMGSCHANPTVIINNKFPKENKKMEIDAPASCSNNAEVAMTKMSFSFGSAEIPLHSNAVSSEVRNCTEFTDSSRGMCLDLSNKVDSSVNLATDRTKINTQVANCVPSGACSRSVSPKPSDGQLKNIVNKTNTVQINNAQTSIHKILKRCNEGVRNLCVSVKDDGLQEPSSTTADCVSSTSSSSVNNVCDSNTVSTTELPFVESYVSTPGPTDEIALTNIVAPSGPLKSRATSCTVPYDMPCRSSEPDTSCITTTTSVVTSSVTSAWSLEKLVPSPTSSAVSGCAVTCVDSTSNVLVTVNCDTDVSSSGTLLVPSSEESSNSATSTTGTVSNTTVLCDTLEPHSSKSGTQSVFHRHLPVQRISSSSISSCSLSIAQSSTQRRKVSLSEYRNRMRRHTGEGDADKTNTSSTAGEMLLKPETFPDHTVELPELPLFEAKAISHTAQFNNNKHADNQGQSFPSVTKKADTDDITEDKFDTIFTDKRPKENLAQRLKREFGVDSIPDCEGKSESSNKKIEAPSLSTTSTSLPGTSNMMASMSLCSQKNPSSTKPASSPQKFNNHPRNQYLAQSCLTPQISPSSFSTSQPSTTCSTVLPVISHHISTPLDAQPQMQPVPPYSPVSHGSVPKPCQTAYTSNNCQSYSATLIRKPPPPPPPHQNYHHIFKPALFK